MAPKPAFRIEPFNPKYHLAQGEQAALKSLAQNPSEHQRVAELLARRAVEHVGLTPVAERFKQGYAGFDNVDTANWLCLMPQPGFRKELPKDAALRTVALKTAFTELAKHVRNVPGLKKESHDLLVKHFLDLQVAAERASASLREKN